MVRFFSSIPMIFNYNCPDNNNSDSKWYDFHHAVEIQGVPEKVKKKESTSLTQK